ncbi:MAG: asparagine synthase-related protein [Algoriphagus sp.]|uniref:asparagine synthetase B family protein n=1 Tax=Algoriphagus sp. TaxID=1872435 RepID=UPI00261C847F|nr:asparagine synthase-related protein [Algoriphagus sp.]MDG1276169.1 asparagine synthase-related protein [Algoriphagus sp.]
MCGIHLIWGKGANKESIDVLLEAGRHRGPDQEASLSPWPGLWVGVNRLKIKHPGPEADQPFWSPDGNYFLIWNGEIYNFQSLGKQLEMMGVTLITRSDTEVLMHWLRIFGNKGLETIEGMYSLILVNLIEKSILVARDKNGEKPLYFSQDPDRLIISSDARGIHKIKKTTIDSDQFGYYFYLRTPLPGKTLFKGVREWKANRNSWIHQHSTFRWDTIAPKVSSELNPSISTFREELQIVVDRQFQADVPVGIQLSGGADSALLYTLWYQQTGIKLPAYTIQPEEKYRKKYNDGIAATRFLSQIPADHQLLEVNQQSLLSNWEDYLQSIDVPVGDSAGFLTWMIGKEAKKNVKVMISGAGADELWGGYRRHQAFDFYLKNKKILLSLRQVLQKLPLGREGHKFFSSIRSDSRRTFLNFEALRPVPHELAEDFERLFQAKEITYLDALDFDRQNYLVQDILRIQDSALMAHGIEGRAPYLDERMIRLQKSVQDPEVLKGKPWIKSSLRDLDLAWIANRKKTGFGLPLQEWFREDGPFSQHAFQSIKAFEKTHGQDFPKEMRELARNPESGVKNHFLILYNLFLIADWLNLQES